MSSSVTKEKNILRKSIKKTLFAFSTQEYTDASAKICRLLETKKLIQSKKCILAFSPLAKQEPDITPWLQLQISRPGKLLFPRIEEGNNMVACEIEHLESRILSRLGTLDPSPEVPITAPEAIDLVLVPGMAFQLINGKRLGKGGGFYDRFLQQLPSSCTRVGICFDKQVWKRIPTENHDFPVHYLLTESGLHYTGRKFEAGGLNTFSRLPGIT